MRALFRFKTSEPVGPSDWGADPLLEHEIRRALLKRVERGEPSKAAWPTIAAGAGTSDDVAPIARRVPFLLRGASAAAGLSAAALMLFAITGPNRGDDAALSISYTSYPAQLENAFTSAPAGELQPQAREPSGPAVYHGKVVRETGVLRTSDIETIVWPEPVRLESGVLR